MLDFEIQRCSRRCAATDRELSPGEVFYSVLITEGADVVRYNYSQEAWQGPPEGAIGWWKSTLPEPSSKRVHWAPNDVLLDYFQQLQTQDQQADTCYILTLLLIRRRIFRLEESEVDQAGREQLVVYCPRNEVEYRVPVDSPSPSRIEQIQEELARLLYAEAA